MHLILLIIQECRMMTVWGATETYFEIFWERFDYGIGYNWSTFSSELGCVSAVLGWTLHTVNDHGMLCLKCTGFQRGRETHIGTYI